MSECTKICFIGSRINLIGWDEELPFAVVIPENTEKKKGH